MINLAQSHPLALHRTVYFTAVLSANLQTRITGGLTSPTVKLRKPGVASASATNVPVEVDATNHPGVYTVLLTAAEIDTAGFATIEIKATNMEPRELFLYIRPAFFCTAATGTLSASAFTTNRTEATNDYWKDALIVALDGANVGQVKKIGAYNGTTKVVTLATINSVQQAFTTAPSNGDNFEIIDR
jgi:hypothetical protein